MKKIIGTAAILAATLLMACPGGAGAPNQAICKNVFPEKCLCDTKQFKSLEALELNAKQKEQVAKLREETQSFHNQQHEKMLTVLTPEQLAKVDHLNSGNLNAKQKEQVAKLQEDAQFFHNQQHEKILAVLTPEQRAKMEQQRSGKEKKCNCPTPKEQPCGCPKGPTPPQSKAGGMGCKNCNDK